MLNKLYSSIGHFFLKRSGDYWEDEEDCEPTSTPYNPRDIKLYNPRKSKSIGIGGNTNGSRGSAPSTLQTPNKEPSYNLRIYSASGGRVIECFSSTHINNNYQESTELYVIAEGANLVDELGKILMIHSLTK
jgi:hypothetical protein